MMIERDNVDLTNQTKDLIAHLEALSIQFLVSVFANEFVNTDCM